MNNLTNRPDEPFGGSDNESHQLAEDLIALHRLPVPGLCFDPQAIARRDRIAVVKQRWRPALLGTAAAAALALFAVGPGVFGGSPQPVSAQEVFEKTHAIAAMASTASSDFSYHMVAKTESFGPPGMETAGANSTAETWYQDPEHQRSETYGEDGELIFGSLQNGQDLWLYSDTPDADGESKMRAAHTTLDVAGFMPLGAQDFGADSLAALLEMYSGNCARAESVGEETIAGRPTYVIEVTQTPETCDLKPVITQDGDLTTVKVENPGAGTGAGSVNVAVGSVNVKASGGGTPGEPLEPEVEFRVVETTTRMWVDQETFITLKSETDSDDGLLFRYEVTEFEVDPDFPPSTFVYEPKPGVEVVEAERPEDIKIVLSGDRGIVSSGTFEAAPALDEAGEDTAGP